MHYTYDRKRTGGRIQAQRMALRLTQEQLSERMDCSHRFIADIERGAVGMSVETLVKACTALKTSPNRLLCDDAQGEYPSSELGWLVPSLENLTPRQRETAIDILRAYLRGL